MMKDADRLEPGVSTEPTVDLQVLERLRVIQRQGAPDIVVRSVRTYLRSSADLMASLRAAVGQRDTDGFTAAAHTLGSSSALVGAARFSALCREMEAKGRSWSPAAAEEHLRLIESECQKVTAFLRASFGEGES